MNDHPGRPGYQHINLSLLGLTGEPPDFLTNPRHNVRLTDVDLALQEAAEFDAYALRRETEFTSRLLVRAMGYHGNDVHGWWFCGRHQALAELADWLNRTQPTPDEHNHAAVAGASEVVKVVTAGPGSGKTAVLGLVAALALPERRRTVPVDALGLAPHWIPSEGCIDVIMYAQNLTDREVLGGLAAAAGFKAATVGEFLEALEQQNGAPERPFTVLIDALDEAATPNTLCSQVVGPLIKHARGRIRLLLGTRPYLLDCLGIPTGDEQRVVDLDSDRFADREALLAYTMRNLIQSRRTSPYRTHPDLLQPVARAVANAADRSFLVARFAAYTLASADTVVSNPWDRQWRSSLPRHAGQAMRDDLTRRLGLDAQRAADLLRPLAYAEGQGLPWEGIWAPLASAISGRTYTDEDLLWLRRNAGSYVVEATESGRSAYRLYHQALTEHLREDNDPAAVHAAFVDTLTESVPYRGDATRDWSRAHPYILNHLAAHASHAGRIDDLLAVPEYLIHAVPHSLTPHLQDAGSIEAQMTAAIYRTSYDLHATAPAHVRRSLLALNAARAGATPLLRRFNQHAQPGEWVPVWATGGDFNPALRHTFTGHPGRVTAVAYSIVDDRPIALAGISRSATFGEDAGDVFVWDLATGAQVGDPLTGHDGPVTAVTCTVLDGRPIALVGSKNVVFVWDLATGLQVGDPFTGHDGPVTAVTCTVLDGRPIALVGTGFDYEGSVFIWDLATGQQVGEPLTGLNNWVTSLACTVLDGRPIALAATSGDPGFNHGTVRVWDLATGQQICDPLAPHNGPVNTVACSVLDGHPIALTGTGDFGGSRRGAVHVWDLATGQQLGDPLTGHEGAVNSVACTVLDGRPIALAGAQVVGVGAVHVWDLTTGQQVGVPFTGHDDSVTAVACTALDNQPIALVGSSGGKIRLLHLSNSFGRNKSPRAPAHVIPATACTDLDAHPVVLAGTGTGYEGAVEMWNLSNFRRIGKAPMPDNFPVTAVACTVLDGRPTALASTVIGDRHALYVWDLATGQQVGDPLTGHDGPVKSLACTVLDGRPIALAGTGAFDDPESGAVYVWDLATGQPIGDPLIGNDGHVKFMACAVLDGRPIVFAGSRKGLSVWDVRARTLLQHVVLPGLRALSWSPARSLAVVLGRDIAVFQQSA
ncbi:WD40 repeat domain-containing protein [Streptomyces sp. ND04-05B]|uniref:WD40 repeat domain-containing protein n=1 Tax=Streptomyces sp. ND04-05B TaxID=3028693 RepID=UPI0029B7DA72|nr:WD40 repeat domain-containing protein [Streptomyces sp. ND04-05B]MDX3067521.1 WD40 repeat domain-containing protein [Streptomyces sp. ND04-05B]